MTTLLKNVIEPKPIVYPHQKYHSIDNLRRKDKEFQYWMEQEKKNPETPYEWIMTEKIHGSNMCFYIYNDGNIRVGKRNMMIGEKEDFCHWQGLLEKYRERLLAIRKSYLGENENEGVIMAVYGEAYGGIYNGKDMPKSKECVRPVQKQVEYCPHIDFMVFDIAIMEGEVGYPDVSNLLYLEFEEAQKLCLDHDMPFTPVLFESKGLSLSEFVSSFDPETFYTTLPAYHNMPERVQGPQVAEGVVLRLRNAGQQYYRGRSAMWKIKSLAFQETLRPDPSVELSRKKHKEAIRQFKSESISPSSSSLPDVPKELEPLLDLLSCYVTLPRLHNVISKIGSHNAEKKYPLKALAGLLTSDAYADFIKDLEQSISTSDNEIVHNAASMPSKKDLKMLKPHLFQLCMEFICEQMNERA